MKEFFGGLGKGAGIAIGLIIMFILMCMCCCIGSNSDNNKKSITSTSEISKVEKEVEVIEEKKEEVIESDTKEPLIFKVGETATNGNITISFTGAEQFSKIKGEYYNDAPQDGNNVFIVMYFDITNESDEEITLFEYDFDVYADNYSAEMNYILMNEPKSGYSRLETLAAGKSGKFYLTFEVPNNWSDNVEAQYKKWLTTNDTINFIATKEDVIVIN